MNEFNKILQIFSKSLNIVFSWGFNSPEPIDNGVIFKCNGFIFSGSVRVVLVKKDTYKIELIDQNGKLTNTINNVSIDNMVNIIDNQVERVDDYRDRVMQEYFC